MKRRAVVTIGALLLAAACSRSEPASESMMVGDRALASCPFGVARYFPPQTFPSHSGDGYNLRTDAPELLASMSEPSLWCGSAPDEAYRLLTYTSLFGRRQPAAIRLERRGEGVRLVLTALTSVRPRDSVGASVHRKVDKSVSANEWAAVLTAVDRAGFWFAPFRPPNAPTYGETWIVEGRRGSHYRAVQFMPDERPSFVAILSAMLNTAGIDTHGNFSEPPY